MKQKNNKQTKPLTESDKNLVAFFELLHEWNQKETKQEKSVCEKV